MYLYMPAKRKSFRKRGNGGKRQRSPEGTSESRKRRRHHDPDLTQAAANPIAIHRTISEDKRLKDIRERALVRKFTKKLKSRARRRREDRRRQRAPGSSPQHVWRRGLARPPPPVMSLDQDFEITDVPASALPGAPGSSAQHAAMPPPQSLGAEDFEIIDVPASAQPGAPGSSAQHAAMPPPPPQSLGAEDFEIIDRRASPLPSAVPDSTRNVTTPEGRDLTNAIQNSLARHISIDSTRDPRLKQDRRSSQLMVFLQAHRNVLHGFGANRNNMHISYIRQNRSAAAAAAPAVATSSTHVTIDLPNHCKPPNCDVIHFFRRQNGDLLIELARCDDRRRPTIKLANGNAMNVEQWSRYLAHTNRLCDFSQNQWRQILQQVSSILRMANSQNIIALVTNIFNNLVGGKRKKTRKLRKSRKSRKSRKTRNKKK